MSLPVILDFSKVEEALKLSSREREVLTARERTNNAAQLIKYSAVGIALVVVSIGVAFWLGMSWHRHQAGQSNILTELLQKPQRDSLQVPTNKIVTDVNLFNSVKGPDLGFFNPYFLVLTSGHRYTTSNANAWERAWCHARFHKNDLVYLVELMDRTQRESVPVQVSQNQRRELGLSDSDVSFLRSRCPWR